MGKIFQGSFSQVKDAISESFATNAYKDMQKLNFGRVLISGGFFIVCTYALFVFGWFMSGDFEVPTVPIDINNEFRNIASSIWYVHAFALFQIIGYTTALAYSRKDNVKSFLVMNIALTAFTVFIVLYFFKIGQLIVYNFSIRIIYDVILLATLLFVGNKIYRNAMEMVYGTKKKRSAIAEWVSANQKLVIGSLFGIWGLSKIIEAVFGLDEIDFETRMIGAIIEFFPLIACGVSFVFIYMFGNLIRSFYLNKYSEEFRVMFDVKKDDWYGIKLKSK